MAQGKGYGEGEIISWALDHSELLSSSPAFVKLTGRVEVRNLGSLLARMDARKDYFNRMSPRAQGVCDTRMFACTIGTYREHLEGLYEGVDDRSGTYIEHLFAQRIRERRLDTYCTRVCPDYRGMSGSTGRAYDLPRWKFIVRSVLHRAGLMGV